MSEKTPRRAAKAVRRPSGGSGAGGWPQRLAGLWTDVLGGMVAAGRVGKALGPLVTKHGETLVANAFRRYLETGRRLGAAERRFLSAEDFARRFGDFAPEARPPEPVPELAATGPVIGPSRDEMERARAQGRQWW